MNYYKTVLIGACSLLLHQAVQGASFQNLNFESTTLPPDGPGGFQPLEVALPGWSAFLGDEPASGILYNDLFLGTAFVGLSGTSFPVLSGEFSVLLKPGVIHFPGVSVSASLAQTGLVPADASFLQFRATTGSIGPTVQDYFGLYIDGERLQVFPAIEQPGPITATFSADVSRYAGREVTLRLTSFNLGPAGPNALILDDLAFVPIPEPCTWALFGLVTLALGLNHWRVARRG